MARPSKVWLRSSDNCWCVTWKGKKVNLGVKGFQNESLAWSAFNRLRSGESLTPVPFPTAPTTTVRQVVDSFLASATGVESETLNQYRRFLLPFADRFADQPASQMTAPVVEAYSHNPNPTTKTKRKSKPVWNHNSRSKFLGVVVTAFRFAERSRLIDRSPLVGLKKPTQTSRAADVLIDEEEFQKLVDAATKQFRPILRFIYLTGCRPNEASQLVASDIDWKNETVTVRKHKTQKTGKKRILYLCTEALELLRERTVVHPYGLLFRTRVGNKWDWRSLGYAMRSTAKKAGLKKVLYGLRHSFASTALEKGIPDVVCAALLGHSVRTLHQHYSHIETKTKLLSDAAKQVR